MTAEALLSLFAGFVLFIWVIGIVMLLTGLAAFVFWIMMIIDVAKRKFKKPNDKIVWVLVVVLAGVIGATVYYFVVKRKKG